MEVKAGDVFENDGKAKRRLCILLTFRSEDSTWTCMCLSVCLFVCVCVCMLASTDLWYNFEIIAQV